MRREHAALRSGKLIDLYLDAESYVFARQLGAETIVVAFNCGNRTKEVRVPVGAIDVKDGVTLKSLIGGGASAAVVNGEARLMLAPQMAMAFGVQ